MYGFGIYLPFTFISSNPPPLIKPKHFRMVSDTFAEYVDLLDTDLKLR